MELTEILTGGTEIISGIAAEWTDLCNEGASNLPFLRPEWFLAFVNNFESKIDLVTVRRDGKLRAVLPLVSKTSNLHGIQVRKLQAVFNLNTQRFDLIHGADEAERGPIVQAMWSAIKNNTAWDVVEFRLVDRDSWLGDILALAEKENHKTGIWQMDSAPFITLPHTENKERSIDNYFKGSRTHLRQELNRRLRRLKEIGNVEFTVTRGFTNELMKTYLDLEARGWKGRGGTAVTDDPSVVRLHEEFASKVADNDSLYIYELKLDGSTIAMSLNIRYDKETVHWKTSYDEAYRRYSPGNLLFRELLTDCVKNGSPEIDFLSPPTPNKSFWASGEREHVAFYIFQNGLYGKLLWAWKFGVISGLRDLKTDRLGPMLSPQTQK
ncbi:MAG: GNAT family N-acetyltransferase [Pyrinomonadaceae bacterium]